MKLFRSMPALFFLVTLGLGWGAGNTFLAEPVSPAASPMPAIIFVEAPAVVPGDLTGRFPQGSRLVRFSPGTPSRTPSDLTPEFFAAADPQVSFDASHVLFSGRKTRRARWQIWEMNADGSDKRQLTHGPGDCLQPAYLPRNQIVFTMVGPKGSGRTSAIYVSEKNGADTHPITFGPGNFRVETVLRSGRILVSADSVLAAGGKGDASRVFYTLRPDGSGLTLFRRDDRPHIVRTGAEELEDGTVLFVERRERRDTEIGGALAWIHPAALHNAVITPPGADCWSAHQLSADRLVVAKKDSGSSASAGRFGLYQFDLATKSFGSAIYRNPKVSSVQAVPLEPRPSPLNYWSILHPKRDYGRVICLNSYLSADAAHGRLAEHIARVRVIALQPGDRHERVLGEAPVESDGSFYIRVPANLPIRFALLNSKGSVIRAQRSWVWARTGEDVGCLGCHESRALAPENHWPLALKRLDAPFPVGVPWPSHSRH